MSDSDAEIAESMEDEDTKSITWNNELEHSLVIAVLPYLGKAGVSRQWKGDDKRKGCKELNKLTTFRHAAKAVGLKNVSQTAVRMLYYTLTNY